MDLFHQLLQSASVLMTALLINSAYAGILGVLIIVLKRLYTRLPSGVEYVLWCIVFIRLVLPIDLSMPYSLGYFSHDIFSAQFPSLFTQTSWLGEWHKQALFKGATLTWFNLFVMSWLLLAGIIAMKYFKLKIKLSRLLAKAHPVENAWLDKTINLWRREFNILRPVIVIDSNDFSSPFTFAIFSPVLFIPQELLKEQDKKILAPIVAHELAHIKRLDALWLIFQNLVQIVLCFNPIVWFMVRRLNSLREEICDQKVLAQATIDASEYADSLLRVLRLNLGQRSPEHFAAFFLSRKSIFQHRIKRICTIEFQITDQKWHLTLGLLAALFLLPYSRPLPPVESVRTPTFLPKKRTQPSPFPVEIEKQYQAPVLIHANKQNKDKEHVDFDG